MTHRFVLSLLRSAEGENEVRINGYILNPRISQNVYNHSPDGFEWGYSGSGPSQLALALAICTSAKHLDQFPNGILTSRWLHFISEIERHGAIHHFVIQLAGADENNSLILHSDISYATHPYWTMNYGSIVKQLDDKWYMVVRDGFSIPPVASLVNLNGGMSLRNTFVMPRLNSEGEYANPSVYTFGMNALEQKVDLVLPPNTITKAMTDVLQRQKQSFDKYKVPQLGELKWS